MHRRQLRAAGLRLASVNAELGSDHKTDRGVLVLKIDRQVRGHRYPATQSPNSFIMPAILYPPSW